MMEKPTRNASALTVRLLFPLSRIRNTSADPRLARIRINQREETRALALNDHVFAQHAQASIVKVELHRNNGIFFINVHDNGCGIGKADMHKATSSGSGLVGMRERVNDMEGTMAVAGIPGQGTTIRIELPIA